MATMRQDSVLERLSQAWPVLVTLGTMLGAGFVGHYRIEANARRIEAIEARAAMSEAQAREHLTQAAVELERFHRVEDSSRATADTLREITAKLDRLCYALSPKCRGD